MIIFSNGIVITTVEQLGLLHMVSSPEAWLLKVIAEKAKLRRAALITEWQPRLFADPSVTELPADEHELCDLIMARDDYKTRFQQDIAQNPPVPLDKHSTVTFEAVDRSGTTMTLFVDGLDLPDIDGNCILAYVPNLEDWVLGALLGQINRGRKLMLREWQPIILADPEVATMPATEDGLINMIVAREDYQNRSN